MTDYFHALLRRHAARQPDIRARVTVFGSEPAVLALDDRIVAPPRRATPQSLVPVADAPLRRLGAGGQSADGGRSGRGDEAAAPSALPPTRLPGSAIAPVSGRTPLRTEPEAAFFGVAPALPAGMDQPAIDAPWLPAEPAPGQPPSTASLRRDGLSPPRTYAASAPPTSERARITQSRRDPALPVAVNHAAMVAPHPPAATAPGPPQDTPPPILQNGLTRLRIYYEHNRPGFTGQGVTDAPCDNALADARPDSRAVPARSGAPAPPVAANHDTITLPQISAARTGSDNVRVPPMAAARSDSRGAIAANSAALLPPAKSGHASDGAGHVVAPQDRPSLPSSRDETAARAGQHGVPDANIRAAGLLPAGTDAPATGGADTAGNLADAEDKAATGAPGQGRAFASGADESAPSDVPSKDRAHREAAAAQATVDVLRAIGNTGSAEMAQQPAVAGQIDRARPLSPAEVADTYALASAAEGLAAHSSALRSAHPGANVADKAPVEGPMRPPFAVALTRKRAADDAANRPSEGGPRRFTTRPAGTGEDAHDGRQRLTDAASAAAPERRRVETPAQATCRAAGMAGVSSPVIAPPAASLPLRDQQHRSRHVARPGNHLKADSSPPQRVLDLLRGTRRLVRQTPSRRTTATLPAAATAVPRVVGPADTRRALAATASPTRTDLTATRPQPARAWPRSGAGSATIDTPAHEPPALEPPAIGIQQPARRIGEIVIGQIEIRLLPDTTPTARPARPPARRIGIDDYLRRHAGREDA